MFGIDRTSRIYCNDPITACHANAISLFIKIPNTMRMYNICYTLSLDLELHEVGYYKIYIVRISSFCSKRVAFRFKEI